MSAFVALLAQLDKFACIGVVLSVILWRNDFKFHKQNSAFRCDESAQHQQKRQNIDTVMLDYQTIKLKIQFFRFGSQTSSFFEILICRVVSKASTSNMNFVQKKQKGDAASKDIVDLQLMRGALMQPLVRPISTAENGSIGSGE